MAVLPKTTVVVITFNGNDHIDRFLDSYIQYTPSEVQLVAVDNASADDTVKKIRAQKNDAHIIENKINRGFAGGANQGIHQALSRDSQYVVIVNQDIIFYPQWLEPLIETLERESRIGAAQPKILLHPQTDRVNSCGNALHILGFGYTMGYQHLDREWKCAKTTRVAYCSGGAVALRADTLKKVGLFDEEFFMYHEDSDLSWRMQLAGYDTVVCPQSVVAHHYEFSRSIQKFYYIERNRIIMLLKNYSLKTLLLLAPLFFMWEVGMLSYSILGQLLKKRTIGVKEKIGGYAFFFKPSSWNYLRDARKASQQLRRVSDREITQLFTARIDFQDIDNPIIRNFANPFTEWYWGLVKNFL